MAAAAPKKKAAPVPKSENAPQFQVVDEVFVWIDPDQGDIRVPLRFKTKLLRSIMHLAKAGEAAELEQLFALLDGLGDAETPAQLDEMWWEDTERLVQAYFAEFGKKHQATVGES